MFGGCTIAPPIPWIEKNKNTLMEIIPWWSGAAPN
jgi:hypothetical protein